MKLVYRPLLAQITLWLWGTSSVPSVQLNQGRVQGFRHAAVTKAPAVDQFLGIPFAQPPVGHLRFAAPQPVKNDPAQVVLATEYGPACVQPNRPSFGDMDPSVMSEDCLSVNVIRPSGTTRSAKLPIAVWIYGGAFRYGQSSLFAGENIVRQSIALNEPIIYVSLNYRLNSFGFLASSDVEARANGLGDVALNAGLLDQRLALQWVKANIEAFGGDPSKVTVFGESAGAMSIGAHLIAQEGKSETLFRAAILESGSSSGPTTPPPSAHDRSFARFVRSAGCTPSDLSVVECLRALSTDELLAATALSLEGRGLGGTRIEDVPPFGLVLDGDFYGIRPSESLNAGKVKSVPIITGTNLDEGTLFAPHDVKSEEGFKRTIEAVHAHHKPPTISQLIDTLASLYPDIPSEGSPYPGHSLPFEFRHYPGYHGTQLSNYALPSPEETQERLGPISDAPDDRIFPPFDSNQFKRLASVFGDLLFESPRRALLETLQEKFVENASGASPSWSYHFRHPSVTTPRHLGVRHGIEIPYVFAAFNELPNETGDVSRFMSSAWIRFVNRLDPNGPGLPLWPRYYAGGVGTGEAGHIIQVRGRNITVVKDDWRQEAMKWLAYDAGWNEVTER